MTLITFISTYWELVVAFAFLVFYALWTYFKVGNHELRIGKLEDNKESTEKTISSLDVRLSAMDGKLDILVAGYKKERE